MSIASSMVGREGASVASIRWLVAPTSECWVEQAIARPMEVLIDHAHCERKAAGSAVQLMFRYLCEPGLGEALSPLAREELEHFEQVLALLKSRGRYLEPLRSPAYGALLANVILIPCAMKLKTKSSMEALNNELVIEGVMFINDGGNPRVMGDMLGSFLDGKARERAMAAMGN